MNIAQRFCNNDPAILVDALIGGLKRHRAIEGFCLDFDSYGVLGRWENEIYYGGASALVLIQLSDLSFAPEQLDDEYSRADLMYTDVRDLINFEESIELLRRGILPPLEKYFNLPVSGRSHFPWDLQNDTWEEELPRMIGWWEKLTGQDYEYSKLSLGKRWKETTSAAREAAAVS